MKTCNKCNQSKELTEFNKHPKSSDGYLNQCKSCVKQRKAEYYIRDKDKIRTKHKEYYNQNKDVLTSNMKEYYKEHKEHIIEQHKEYKETHTELYKEYNKNWRENNREYYNQKQNETWRKRRAKKLGVHETYSKQDKEQTLVLFNQSCANCGVTENLHIDHHYPLSKGYPLTMQNAVVLCGSCNCTKGDKLPEEFYTKETLDYINEKLSPPA